MAKELAVTGPRAWHPRWRVSEHVRAKLDAEQRRKVFAGWVLSEPEPVVEVPIIYELAYGGLMERPAPDGTGEPLLVADERNPLGRGWLDPDHTPNDAPRPAPQIEDADEPISAPHTRYTPAGLSAIPPAWLPRRPLGGTYDQNWLDHVWPNWPPDYDYAYHQAAHPSLIAPAHLQGQITCELVNLRPEPDLRTWRLVLPDAVPHVLLTRWDGTSEAVRMALDTLLIDLTDPDPNEGRVFTTWRVVFDMAAVQAITLMAGAGLRRGARAPVPDGLRLPPHPSEVAQYLTGPESDVRAAESTLKATGAPA